MAETAVSPRPGPSFEALRRINDGTFDWGVHYSHRLMVCQGEIDLIFTHRFAQGYLEGPCVRVNYEIPHGLSGGPAINAEGYVSGVNSAGSSSIFEDPSSLISIIYPSLASRLDLTAVNALNHKITAKISPRVIDLMLLGKILTDDSEQLVGFSDSSEQVAVHALIHEDDYEFVYESLREYN